MPPDQTTSPSTSPPPSSPVRRRVRVALATLRRVQDQQTRFVSDYGKASTARERFTVAADAMRAAAAPGAHQPDREDVDRALERLSDAITAAVAELHSAQQTKATKTIAADQRRIERNERRRHAGAGNHPNPERPA